MTPDTRKLLDEHGLSAYWLERNDPQTTERVIADLLDQVKQDARREALEEACKAACYFCGEGTPVEHGADGYWYHPPVVDERRGYGCSAHAIRALISQEPTS